VLIRRVTSDCPCLLASTPERITALAQALFLSRIIAQDPHSTTSTTARKLSPPNTRVDMLSADQE